MSNAKSSPNKSAAKTSSVELALLAASALTIGAAFGGCSANHDDTTGTFDEVAASSSSGNGGAGASATGGPATSASVGTFVGSGGATSTSTGTGLEDGGQCASASAKAELTPLDMIIILDQSGSMLDDQKWPEVTAAINAFVADPKSAGIGIGVNYFPADASQGDECNWQSYAVLEVPIAALPDNAQAMSDSIAAHMPTSGNDTPMHPALRGALAAGSAYQDMNPTHKVVVVLATDGQPESSCGNDSIPLIAGLAASALSYDGVQTYTIAVTGADLMSLDQVAAAGGTGMSYDATNVTLFEQQMEDIRTNALACDFPIPPPPDGKKLDVNKVNVSYTPGGSMTPVTLPRADDLQDCGAGAGWYYDDPIHPTKIELCPSSCTTVQADTTAQLDVLFGCQTMIN